MDGQQTQGRQPDIPDKAKQEIPKVQFAPEVKAERNIRRFIRKDGVFCKDYQHFFDVETGMDDKGRILYKPTKTIEEAEEFIVDLCEKSGRKIVIDDVTKRPKAVPGWNLEIRVPGMEVNEQTASVESEAIMRERATSRMLDTMQIQMKEMAAKMEEQAATIAELTGSGTKEAKADGRLEDGTIADLVKLAKERGIDIDGITLKADIIEKIRSESK